MLRRFLRTREEPESGDREFENVVRVDFFIEDRNATVYTTRGPGEQYIEDKEYIEDGVYKVVTGDGVFLESALAENFEISDMVVTLDVHPSCAPVNAHFDEAKGEVELYLAGQDK